MPSDIARGSFRAMLRPTEAIVIVGCLGFAWACFHIFDGFEHYVALVKAFEAYQLDEVLFVLMLSGGAGFYVALRRTGELHREIKIRLEAQRRALQLVHDPLSGLPNRQLLSEELVAATATSAPFAILLIDLDQFKPINDLHGHGVGDQLLIAVAHRLKSIDQQLFVSRLGGDEFVCLVRDHVDPDHLKQLAITIVDELRKPFVISGRTLSIGATIGISCYPQDFHDPKRLLGAADLAMYSAKRAGRGTYAFFDIKLDQTAREKAELEADLRDALKGRDIKPYFQPIINLESKEICGFEALARWEHPAHGLIPPAKFIPIVEDLGLQTEFLEVILSEAAHASAAWPLGTSLSLNVSPLQLQDSLFAARLMNLLHHAGLPANRLILEVTEDAIAGDFDQIATTFAALQSHGVRIALDDFGKSYANLANLRELNFDHLKIHASFLSYEDNPNRNVLRALVALANELGMPARAQGVETFEVAELLKALGCVHAQGFHFGPAMPHAEFQKLLWGSTGDENSQAA